MTYKMAVILFLFSLVIIGIAHSARLAEIEATLDDIRFDTSSMKALNLDPNNPDSIKLPGGPDGGQK